MRACTSSSNIPWYSGAAEPIKSSTELIHIKVDTSLSEIVVALKIFIGCIEDSSLAAGSNIQDHQSSCTVLQSG